MLPSAWGSPTTSRNCQTLSPQAARTRALSDGSPRVSSRLRTLCSLGQSTTEGSENQKFPWASPDAIPAKRHSGRVDLIVGPMFAGKTTELIRRAREASHHGSSVLLVKSAKDDRYSANHITSHAGDKLACHAAPELGGLRTKLRQQYEECSVVAIDEAQFFPDLVEFVIQAADCDGKSVFVAGLDGDFKRQRFGDILDLVPMADSITKLRGKCQFCDQPSLFSLRVAAVERQELVGGRDTYVPTCRMHYMQMSKLRPQSP